LKRNCEAVDGRLKKNDSENGTVKLRAQVGWLAFLLAASRQKEELTNPTVASAQA
jgi:hypothetical protein